MALPYTSILAGASGQSSGYSISNSARFVSGNSGYLYRTPGSAGDQKTWTLSFWIKRATLGVRQSVFGCYDGSLASYIEFQADDTITLYNEITGGGVSSLTWVTTQVFRDPGAWMHIVWQYDTTQATANNRSHLYVNGTEVTAFTRTQTPAQNAATGPINSAFEHRIGRQGGSTNYLSAYLANVYFVNAQALTSSSFGQTNTSGVWVPKAYSGTYGTNGFLMAFLNSAALGTDTSGNGNTFTSSGLVAGDCMSDTPTLNFCTLNPLFKFNGTWALSSGNLTATYTSSTDSGVPATMGMTSGKYYWEVKAGSASSVSGALVSLAAITSGDLAGTVSFGSLGGLCYGYYAASGNKISNGVSTAYGNTYTTNDIIGIAFDATNGKLWFAKNNTWQASGDPVAGTNAAYTSIDTSSPWFPGVFTFTNEALTANFGATAFTYTPPTGFVALNSTNLPAPAIKDGSAHFQTALHTGTGSAITINQSGNSTFTSDFVWTKGRSGATNHVLSNIISGTGKYLSSNATTAETTDAQALTAFGAGSISYGTLAAASTSAATYVDWMWKGGGAGVSNTSGSITSTVSANTTAGFSVVTYTGTGVNATVGHGLGVAPKLVIYKATSRGGDNWAVYHAGYGPGGVLFLDLTNAVNTGDAAGAWQSTAPTSSVFYVGSASGSGNTNASGVNYGIFCHAEIAGYSKIGSYTGNGSADGPFVYCGFRPAYVRIKRTDSTGDWRIFDTARDTYNVSTKILYPNGLYAEDTGAGSIDIISNGFKLRTTTAAMNTSSATYVFDAYASNPFGGSTVAPPTAR